MRSRRPGSTAVVAALAVTGLALPGSAAEPGPQEAAVGVFAPSAGPVAPLGGYLGSSRPGAVELGRAWQRQQVAALSRAGVPERALLAGQAGGRPARLTRDPLEQTVSAEASSEVFFAALGLVAAGDLDGDGRGDLLDVRYAPAARQGTTLALVARRADTGRVIWQRRITTPKNHFVFAVPARVGAAGGDGVALYDLGFAAAEDGVTTSVALTGLAGRTGAPAWRYGATGRVRFGEQGLREEAVPSPVGQLEGGRSTGFLVSITDSSTSGGPVSGGTTSGSARAVVVDGGTGATRDAGPAVSSDDARPTVRGVVDVSGDRVDDVAFLVAGADPVLVVRRATDGSEVWRRTDLALQPGADVYPAGPVTGGPVQDLAVATGRPRGGSGPLPFGLGSDDAEAGSGDVVLVRGTDGARQFSAPGVLALPLGQAGSPRRPALGVVQVDSTHDGSSATVALTVSAHAPDGQRLYQSVQRLTARDDDAGEGQDSDTTTFATVFEAGDLDADRATDLGVLLYAQAGDAQRSSRLLLDGATGARLHRAGDPLFGSLSSHGDDLATADAGKGVLVKARSGRTGKPVWAVRLAPGRQLRQAFASSADVHAGPCDDVTVSAAGSKDDYTALLSNDGRLRWSLSGAPGSADVRPVVPGRPGTRRCS